MKNHQMTKHAKINFCEESNGSFWSKEAFENQGENVHPTKQNKKYDKTKNEKCVIFACTAVTLMVIWNITIL